MTKNIPARVGMMTLPDQFVKFVRPSQEIHGFLPRSMSASAIISAPPCPGVPRRKRYNDKRYVGHHQTHRTNSDLDQTYLFSRYVIIRLIRSHKRADRQEPARAGDQAQIPWAVEGELNDRPADCQSRRERKDPACQIVPHGFKPEHDREAVAHRRPGVDQCVGRCEIANKNMALNSDGNGPVPLAVSRTARVTKKAARTGARRATTKSFTNVVEARRDSESQLLPIRGSGGRTPENPGIETTPASAQSARKITVHSIQRENPPPIQNTVPPSFAGRCRRSLSRRTRRGRSVRT